MMGALAAMLVLTDARSSASTPLQGGSYGALRPQDNKLARDSVAAAGQMRDAASSPPAGEPNRSCDLVGGK